jgi:hypothetical protein
MLYSARYNTGVVAVNSEVIGLTLEFTTINPKL